jgi:hypothetical protein
MYSKQKGIMENLKKGAIIMVEMGMRKICSGAFGAVQEHSPNTLNMPVLPMSPSPHSPTSSSPHPLILIPMFISHPLPLFLHPHIPFSILPSPYLFSSPPPHSHISHLMSSPSHITFPIPKFPTSISQISLPCASVPLSTTPFCNPLKSLLLIEALSGHHRELLIHPYTY